MDRRKIILVSLIGVLVILGGAAIYMGVQLSQQPAELPLTGSRTFPNTSYTCTGACESGKQCNTYGDPPAGEMWSCYKNPDDGNKYECAYEDTNSGDNSCYLSCSGNWKACGCDTSTCDSKCKAKIGSGGGSSTYTMTCDACGQKFTCSCSKPKPTPTPNIPCGSTKKCSADSDCITPDKNGIQKTCDAAGQCTVEKTNLSLPVECDEKTDSSLNRCTLKVGGTNPCPTGYTKFTDSANGTCGCIKTVTPTPTPTPTPTHTPTHTPTPVPLSCKSLIVSRNGNTITITASNSGKLNTAKNSMKFYWKGQNDDQSACTAASWTAISGVTCSNGGTNCSATFDISKIGGLVDTVIFYAELYDSSASPTLLCSGNPGDSGSGCVNGNTKCVNSSGAVVCNASFGPTSTPIPKTALISDTADRVLLGAVMLLVGLIFLRTGWYLNLGTFIYEAGSLKLFTKLVKKAKKQQVESERVNFENRF